MQKIPSVFVRDFDLEVPATKVVEPGCEWVLDGEGRATVKWDGSACLVLSSKLYRRHRVKAGKEPPPRWFHWSTVAGVATGVSVPPNSGHGWIAVYSSPADVHHRSAWRHAEGALEDGTYELIGPSVQKNPYGLVKHVLVRHGGVVLAEPQGKRSYAGIRAMVESLPHEGIVFHDEDGRMAKVKLKDFNLPWPRMIVDGRREPVAEQGVVPGFVRGTV